MPEPSVHEGGFEMRVGRLAIGTSDRGPGPLNSVLRVCACVVPHLRGGARKAPFDCVPRLCGSAPLHV